MAVFKRRKGGSFMATIKENMNSLTMFKFMASDYNHLFINGKVKVNILSPFKYNVAQSFEEASNDFKSMTQHPVFEEINTRLLAPDMKIIFNSGGRALSTEKYTVLLSSTEKSIVSYLSNEKNEATVIYFSDWEEYLDWWTDIYAVNSIGSCVNPFGRFGSTEMLICVTHCVDLYRRMHMESMLKGRAMCLSVTVQEYINSLKEALITRDNWRLVSSLFELPGLEYRNISLQPKHLDDLEELGFIKLTTDGLIQLEAMTIAIGNEFLNGGTGAVGWQATAQANDAERVIGQGFLTGTARGNHLVYFEPNSRQFSHKIVSKSELVKDMIEWQTGLKHWVKNFSMPVIPDVRVAMACSCACCCLEGLNALL